MADPNSISKELFEAVIKNLEGKIEMARVTTEKENDRQDEAIERQADRSTHPAATQRLLERVEKLEAGREKDQKTIGNLCYRVKVTWGILLATGGILIPILAGIIKGWIGV